MGWIGMIFQVGLLIFQRWLMNNGASAEALQAIRKLSNYMNANHVPPVNFMKKWNQQSQAIFEELERRRLEGV